MRRCSILPFVPPRLRASMPRMSVPQRIGAGLVIAAWSLVLAPPIPVPFCPFHGWARRDRVGGGVTDSIHLNPDRTMNKGLIWTIVGILLIVALIIWITRAM